MNLLELALPGTCLLAYRGSIRAQHVRAELLLVDLIQGAWRSA